MRSQKREIAIFSKRQASWHRRSSSARSRDFKEKSYVGLPPDTFF